MKIDLLPESHDEITSIIGKYYDEYKTQRADIDLASELNDTMYAAGTSRGTMDVEQGKWIPLVDDNQSNVGSTLFNRGVNTRAGMLGAIIASGRQLWHYTDTYIDGVPLAQNTNSFEAGVMNGFANWALKADGWERKAPEFCTSVYKDGNVFALVGMREEERTVWQAEEVAAGTSINPETGVEEPVMVKKLKQKKGVAFKYPTFSFPYPRNVFLDKYISDMQRQSCVIINSMTSRSLLMAEGKLLDQEAVMAIGTDARWDGSEASAGKDNDATNLGRDFDPSTVTGTMLRWDVYLTIPVQDGEFYDNDVTSDDTEYEMKRFYIVGVGNTANKMTVLKITDQFDPDGEIPLQPVRCIPSDGDMFYHATLGEIIRSTYCAECAIRNATIDNMAIRARPPIKVRSRGMGLVKDLTWKPDQKWFMDDLTAIEKFEPPEITQQSQVLINQLREESQLAMATDQARLGEYAGARTSKYEVQRVTGATDTTVALQNAYVIGQLLPWMARKFLSYTREFVDTEIITRVVNTHLPMPVRGETIGSYDISVDIVGQYMDEQEKAAQANEAMQLISTPANAQLLPPATRLALLKQFFEARKFDVSKLDFDGWTKDSEANAINRIEQMLQTGVLVPPVEGENVDVHLRVARAQYQRWRGLENTDDPRSANIPVLLEYIKALQDAKLLQEQQLAQTAQGMQQAPQQEQAPQGELQGMMQ